MKEAIERVIAELSKASDESGKILEKQKKKEDRMYGYGRRDGLTRAINLLNEVLANGENDSSGIPRNDGQAQEQNEKRDHAG